MTPHRLAVGLAFQMMMLPSAAAELPDVHLTIVGGLSGTSQYIEHEEPFWTKRIAEHSNGHITAEISPADGFGSYGSKVPEMMRLGIAGPP